MKILERKFSRKNTLTIHFMKNKLDTWSSSNYRLTYKIKR